MSADEPGSAIVYSCAVSVVASMPWNMYVRAAYVENCTSERQSSDSNGLPNIVEIIVSVIATPPACSRGPTVLPIDQPGAALITHDWLRPATAGRTALNRCA